MMQTESQKWAKAAYTHVLQVREADAAVQSEYVTLAQRFGSMVKKGGLVQTLAFLKVRAASREAHRLFLDHLSEHLRDELKGGAGAEALLKHCGEVDLTRYMWLTRRLLDVSMWYRRYGEALLATGEEG